MQDLKIALIEYEPQGGNRYRLFFRRHRGRRLR